MFYLQMLITEHVLPFVMPIILIISTAVLADHIINAVQKVISR